MSTLLNCISRIMKTWWPHATAHAGWDGYRELKRNARRIHRRKQKRGRYELSMKSLTDKGNAKKFYKWMRRLIEGLKIGADSCVTQRFENKCSIPNPQKGNPTYYTDSSGKTRVIMAYKVLSSVFCKRLQPTVSNQCGCRPGKSAIK